MWLVIMFACALTTQAECLLIQIVNNLFTQDLNVFPPQALKYIILHKIIIHS